MSVFGLRFAKVAGVAMMIAVLSPQVASAQQNVVQSGAVRALVIKLESALTSLGCDASQQEYVNALQAAVATSGDDPATVQAAINMVENSQGLCGPAKPALAQVDATVMQALQTTYYATAGGPGPGSPIGPPTAAVSGAGSDYQPR